MVPLMGLCGAECAAIRDKAECPHSKLQCVNDPSACRDWLLG